jgi:hypothetical protein
MSDPTFPVLSEIVRCIRRDVALGQQRVKVFVSDGAVVVGDEDLTHFLHEDTWRRIGFFDLDLGTTNVTGSETHTSVGSFLRRGHDLKITSGLDCGKILSGELHNSKDELEQVGLLLHTL